MSFVRSKVINGCGPYYYKVENRWVPGKGSRQKVIRYLGPGGDDGVVKYSSAYITGVESELVVRSGHS